MTDQLTGLLTRPAFLTLANRDRLLAERLSRKMLLLLAEPPALGGGTQRLDLALVEAADGLRALAGPAALAARIENALFGVEVLDTLGDSAEEVRARFLIAESQNRIAFGAALFDPQHPVSLDALMEQAAVNLRSGSRNPAVQAS